MVPGGGRAVYYGISRYRPDLLNNVIKVPQFPPRKKQHLPKYTVRPPVQIIRFRAKPCWFHE
jgi:hypothetical protein